MTLSVSTTSRSSTVTVKFLPTTMSTHTHTLLPPTYSPASYKDIGDKRKTKDAYSNRCSSSDPSEEKEEGCGLEGDRELEDCDSSMLISAYNDIASAASATTGSATTSTNTTTANSGSGSGGITEPPFHYMTQFQFLLAVVTLHTTKVPQDPVWLDLRRRVLFQV